VGLPLVARSLEHVALRFGLHEPRKTTGQCPAARYRVEGEAAFAPRSRRPKSSPSATPASTVELVLRLGKQLTEQGLDAGADTIGWHLLQHHDTILSRATINRLL